MKANEPYLGKPILAAGCPSPTAMHYCLHSLLVIFPSVTASSTTSYNALFLLPRQARAAMEPRN